MHCFHSLIDMSPATWSPFRSQMRRHFSSGSCPTFPHRRLHTLLLRVPKHLCLPCHSLPQDIVITAYCLSIYSGALEAPGGLQSLFRSRFNLLPQSYHLACHSVNVRLVKTKKGKGGEREQEETKDNQHSILLVRNNNPKNKSNG